MTGLCMTDEDEELVCVVLNSAVALCYLLVLTLSATFLATKFAKEKERKWQILFHTFLMCGCFVRMIYFIFGIIRMKLNFLAQNVILDSIPAFFLFSSYFVLLFFWTELYHNNTGKLVQFRNRYILLNVLMYSIVAILLILDVVLYDPLCPDCEQHQTPPEIALHSFTGTLFLILSLTYALYGYRLYKRFAALPSFSGPNNRKKSHARVLNKLAFITSLFTFFFFIRFLIILAWMIGELSSYVWFDPVYYFFLEIVPILLLFYVFYRTSSPASQGSLAKVRANRPSETTFLVNSYE